MLIISLSRCLFFSFFIECANDLKLYSEYSFGSTLVIALELFIVAFPLFSSPVLYSILFYSIIVGYSWIGWVHEGMGPEEIRSPTRI